MNVGRIVRERFKQRRIAVGPAFEEEFLVEAFGAVRSRADAQAVGDQGRADAAGAVVDAETVPDAGELTELIELIERFGITGLQLVVENDRELAKRGLRLVNLSSFAAGVLGRRRIDRRYLAGNRHHDRIQIAMNDLFDDLPFRRRAGPSHRQQLASLRIDAV